jgi:arylsulfatase A-like enzyme
VLGSQHLIQRVKLGCSPVTIGDSPIQSLQETSMIQLRRKLSYLLVIAALFSLTSDSSRGADDAKPQRPNIIFVFTDDHCIQAMSCYGSNRNKTPNMDRLAREGMLFRNCFVTNSICGPSRAVIQTGKHSHLNGFLRNGMTFNGGQQTFPKLLRKAGYQTAVIGKWHLRSDPTGFDHSEVLYGQGPYYNPPMKRNGERVPHTGYTTDIITDQALKWLDEQRDKTKPFMLMYQHKAPHRNWQPGPKHLTKYDGIELPEPATLFDDWSGRGSASKLQAMTIAKHLSPNDLKFRTPGNLTPEQKKVWEAAYGPKNAAFEKAKLEGRDLIKWKYQRYVKDYLRCIDSVDENLGRVLGYLDISGLAKNTVVIYSSDQGWYLGEHGWYDKRWMYEESLRTPLLVRWPGVVKPGSENSDITSNLDFAQTFLDMAGAEVPSDMQGESIVPLLKGDTPKDWRKSFYYHYYEFPGPHSVRRHYGVRTDKFKLINYYRLGEWELYDLEKDPDEMKSIYDDPKYKDQVAELKQELDRLRTHYRVPADNPPVKRPGQKKPKKKGAA